MQWLWNLILAFFDWLFARDRRQKEWGARFTNPPADKKGALPLDPGNSELR
jgi:hypothetical protein